MSTTTFKIHFTENNIRKLRINLTEHDFTSFTTFLNENYQRHLLTDNYILQYLDEDNDLISVDSQIEWEGMTTGKDSVSIHIKRDLYPTEPEESDDEDVDFLEILNAVRSMFSSACRRQQRCPQFKRVCPKQVIRSKFMYCFQTGLSLMENGDDNSLSAAKIYFMKALQFIPGHPSATYNIACVESLLGDVHNAVNALKMAITYGWNNVEHMMEDPDLETIRDTEGYQQCLRFLSNEEPTEDFIPESQPIYCDNTDTESVDIVQDEVAVEVLSVPDITPEVITQESRPEISPEVVAPECESPIDRLSTTLSEMGIVIDEEKLAELSNKFGDDLTQIVNHYFRTLNY